MTKVTKPIAGAKHTQNGIVIKTKEDLEKSRCKAYKIIIK